jgi:hypothetical protein
MGVMKISPHVAVTARNIRYILDNPVTDHDTTKEYMQSALELPVRMNLINHGNALLTVDLLTSRNLAIIVGSAWIGTLWDNPSLSIHTAVSLLPSIYDQMQVAQLLYNYYRPAYWHITERNLVIMNALDPALPSSIPPNIMSQLAMSLASLEQALLAKDPMMPQHLRQSHSLLIQYPETVNLLEDSEVALLIGAAKEHTKIEIVKGKAPSAKAKKPSASDL